MKEVICKIIATITFPFMGIAMGFTMMLGMGVILLVVDIFLYIHCLFSGSSPFIGDPCGYVLPLYVLAVIHGVACLIGDIEFGYPLD